MLRGIGRIFTHRYAAVVWSLAALGLGIALVSTNLHARQKEDFLRGRIAALATHDASQLQGELVSCHATVRTYAAALTASAPRSEARPGQTTRVASGGGETARMAAELASSSPAGFDVCARMESADRAVMKSLDRR